MTLFVLKNGIKIRLLVITIIFLCTLESFLFRFLLVSLEKSESNSKQSTKLGTKENEEWFYFQHVGNEMLIGNPIQYKQMFHAMWDWGVMDIYGHGKEDKYGPYGPGLHSICDISGNGLNSNDVKSGMTVKIRAKQTHWAGWEYMYTTPKGWIAYDKLRNRNDDSDSNNLKQEWIVEKDGSTFCFENKYWTGEYLMGNLGRWNKYEHDWWSGGWRSFDYHWMYVEKDNPNWWRLIPADQKKRRRREVLIPASLMK